MYNESKVKIPKAKNFVEELMVVDKTRIKRNSRNKTDSDYDFL